MVMGRWRAEGLLLDLGGGAETLEKSLRNLLGILPDSL